MAARAMWKAAIRFEDIRVPVKLYSAVRQRTVQFHIVEQGNRTRVKQRMVEPGTGEEIPAGQIQKGYEFEPGRFVILGEQELRSLEPSASREIEIRSFVPPEQISQEWYKRPYYLAPEEKEEDAYFALAEALRSRNREGVAHWVMRRKRYFGSLRAEGSHLMLMVLRHAGEVVSAQQLPAPGGPKLDAREVKMARQLVGALAGDFHPENYRDEYRQRVAELIQTKAEGKPARLPPAKEKRAAPSLTDALSESLAAVKRRSRG